jgi:DNA repair exonuclease SbcCD ATPase subunit
MQTIKNRVILEKIKISNFMSFKSEEFNFQEMQGINLVIGTNHDIPELHNGAGKTALFSAPTHALYGETLHNLHTASIQNRKFLTDPMIIELTLSTQGKKYRIVDSIEKLQVTRLKLFEEIGGGLSEITKPSMKETRRYIEDEILKMSFDTFKRRVILVNDNTKSFFDMNSYEKRKFVEDNFALDVFGRMYSLVHQDCSLIQRELNSKEKEIKSIEIILKDLRKTEKEFQTNKQERINSLILQIQQKFDKLKEIFQVLDVSELQAKITENTANIESNKLKYSEVTNKIHNLDRELAKLEKTLELGDKHSKQYSEVLSRVCKECLVKLKDLIGAPNKQNILDLIEKIKSIIVSFKTDRAQIETLIATLQSKSLKTTSIYNEINNLKHQLQENQKTPNSPVDALIKKNETDLEIIQKSLIEFIEKYNYINFAEFITSEDGVKKYVIKNIIQLLNQRLQFYLAKLGTNYTCIFNEDFDVEFRTETGACEFNNFSSGERMRIKIAAMFSFRDLLLGDELIDFNILVVDEFFDSSIDSSCVNRILEILKDISDKCHTNVFIISHRKEITTRDGFFSSIINIEKKLGESTISRIK